MTDQFDVKAAAKIVEQLANRAGQDWDDRPASYNTDASKLSQEVSKLAQTEHLEDVLAQIKKENTLFAKKGDAPIVRHVDRGGDGKITGIKFNMISDYWTNPVYATVSTDVDTVK